MGGTAPNAVLEKAIERLVSYLYYHYDVLKRH